MKFRRAPEAKATVVPTVEEEPAGSPGGTYRVAVAHTEPDHPSSTAAHWGPAYNQQFADMAALIRQVPVGEIDLLAEALQGAAHARSEYSGMDGWEVWVEKLGDDGLWERVG